MQLAEGKEMEDLQEFCYVDVLKYKTPLRIRAKGAGLQQAGSQSVTGIPLSEALDSMLVYIEDQKQGKESQDFDGSKLMYSRPPSTLRFLHPSLWRAHSMCSCVTPSQCARPRALHATVFPRRTGHSNTGGTPSSWRTTAALRRLLV